MKFYHKPHFKDLTPQLELGEQQAQCFEQDGIIHIADVFDPDEARSVFSSVIGTINEKPKRHLDRQNGNRRKDWGNQQPATFLTYMLKAGKDPYAEARYSFLRPVVNALAQSNETVFQDFASVAMAAELTYLGQYTNNEKGTYRSGPHTDAGRLLVHGEGEGELHWFDIEDQEDGLTVARAAGSTAVKLGDITLMSPGYHNDMPDVSRCHAGHYTGDSTRHVLTFDQLAGDTQHKTFMSHSVRDDPRATPQSFAPSS